MNTTITIPAFRYRAVAGGANGTEILEIFTSDVEYVAGDDLLLNNGCAHVKSVEQEGISHIDGHDVAVRVLHCALN